MKGRVKASLTTGRPFVNRDKQRPALKEGLMPGDVWIFCCIATSIGIFSQRMHVAQFLLSAALLAQVTWDML